MSELRSGSLFNLACFQLTPAACINRFDCLTGILLAMAVSIACCKVYVCAWENTATKKTKEKIKTRFISILIYTQLVKWFLPFRQANELCDHHIQHSFLSV